MRSKKLIILIAVGVVAVVMVINAQLMPYYAFIHATQEINASHINEILQDDGNTVKIPHVDKLYMGWPCLFMLLLPVIIVFLGSGIVIGFRKGLERKDADVKSKLDNILHGKRVSTSGVIIGGYRAEELEKCFKKECDRLVQEGSKLTEERASFDEKLKQHAELEQKATALGKQLENLKQDHANRLEKVSRLEKSNNNLEVKLVDLEKEMVDLKIENLELTKKILVFEQKNA